MSETQKDGHDPKKAELESEELSTEELDEVDGGVSFQLNTSLSSSTPLLGNSPTAPASRFSRLKHFLL